MTRTADFLSETLQARSQKSNKYPGGWGIKLTSENSVPNKNIFRE